MRWYSVFSLGTSRIDGLTAEGLPDLLTVEEAAALLRIGRNQAYDLTRQWRATNGKSGLPVVEFGRHTLRVPRHALEQLIGRRADRASPSSAPARGGASRGRSHRARARGGNVSTLGKRRETGRRERSDRPAVDGEGQADPPASAFGASDQLPLFDLPASQPPERP